VIEVTGEMVDAFWSGHDAEEGSTEDGLVAVLAIVEPDIRASERERVLQEICDLAGGMVRLRDLVEGWGEGPAGPISLARARSLLRELAAIGGPLDNTNPARYAAWVKEQATELDELRAKLTQVQQKLTDILASAGEIGSPEVRSGVAWAVGEIREVLDPGGDR
jgi:hypothetical protein